MSAASEIERLMDDALDSVIATDLFRQAVDSLKDTLLTGIAESFQGEVSEMALMRAQRLADEAAESLARQLTEAQLSSMGNTLADALAEGKRPRDIGERLQEVQMLDQNRARRYEKMRNYLEESGLSDKDVEDRLEREYQKLLRERRRDIAQTEGRHATSEARRLEAEDRGSKWKRWLTRMDERVCDICAGNEADGVIPIDQPFSSGHMEPPAHPGNCGCSVSYILTERGKESAELMHTRRIEETAAAREEKGLSDVRRK